MLGWLTTCCGAVVVVVARRPAPGRQTWSWSPVPSMSWSGADVVVVVGGFVVVVVVDGFVVVVDGFGATRSSWSARAAPTARARRARGPHTMTAIPARAILFG